MPSGPKKRRAAKKKNDTIASTSTNPAEETPVDVVELSNVASNVSELTIGDDMNTISVTEMGLKENKEEESLIEPASEKTKRNEGDDVITKIVTNMGLKENKEEESLIKPASEKTKRNAGDDVNTNIVTDMGLKENKEEESLIEPTSKKTERNESDDVFKCFLQDPPVFGDTYWLDVLKNSQLGLEGGGNGLTFNWFVNNDISSSNETGDPFVESVPKQVQDFVEEPFEISNNEPPAAEQPVLKDSDVCSDQTDVFGRVKILVNVLVCQSNEMKLLAEKQKCLSEEINLNLSKLMDEFNSEKPSRVTGVSKETAKFDSQTTEPDILINEEEEHSESFVNEKETFSPPKPEENGSSYEHKQSSSPNDNKQFIHGLNFEDAY